MASKKSKKKPAPIAKSNPVPASDLVEIEREIAEHRAALADAVGRYNDALEHAQVNG